MKYKLFLIFFIFLSFYASAQQKPVNSKTPSLCEMIRGRWHAEDDKSVILMFGGTKYIELYDKDTTDNLQYVLSYDCKLQNKVRAKVYKLSKSKPLYLLLYKDGNIEQCNELLNLNNNTLSWINSTNGKIFIYKRIK